MRLVAGCRQCAQHADCEACGPPFKFERQCPGKKICGGRKARAGLPRASGSKDAAIQIAADQSDQPRDQRQRHQFDQQHHVQACATKPRRRRKVRSIGRRCSKARPIAEELTMKSPTRNDSKPNSVRFEDDESCR